LNWTTDTTVDTTASSTVDGATDLTVNPAGLKDKGSTTSLFLFYSQFVKDFFYSANM
jgi:hypothetical protein